MKPESARSPGESSPLAMQVWIKAQLSSRRIDFFDDEDEVVFEDKMREVQKETGHLSRAARAVLWQVLATPSDIVDRPLTGKALQRYHAYREFVHTAIGAS